MNQFKFFCPSCGGRNETDAKPYNDVAACSMCGHQIPVSAIPAIPPPLPARSGALRVIAKKTFWKSRPAVVVATGLLLAIVWAVMSLNSPREKTCILKLLQADKDRAFHFKGNLGSSATPSQYATAIGGYCDAMENYDMTGCPADFTVAYRQHLRAWRSMQSVAASFPEGFWQGFISGALNALLVGESDGGVGRLQANAAQAQRDIEATWLNVETIAAKYGAAI